jgi:acetyltransferase-like isoleucine patch superfamily enzyme
VLEKLAYLLKGRKIHVDRDISQTYLLGFMFSKVIMLVSGVFKFKRLTPYFVAPSAVIKESSKITSPKGLSIDRGCYIDALSRAGITFGSGVSINKYVTIECTGSVSNIGHGLLVGNNVGIGSHCFFGCAGGISIGDDVIIGNYVSFHSENHNFSDPEIPIRLQGVNRKGIKIGANCWIGAKVTILDGAIIEDGCVIAAGTLVRDGIYTANSVYGGVPAKFIKKRCVEIDAK